MWAMKWKQGKMSSVHHPAHLTGPQVWPLALFIQLYSIVCSILLWTNKSMLASVIPDGVLGPSLLSTSPLLCSKSNGCGKGGGRWWVVLSQLKSLLGAKTEIRRNLWFFNLSGPPKILMFANSLLSGNRASLIHGLKSRLGPRKGSSLWEMAGNPKAGLVTCLGKS